MSKSTQKIDHSLEEINSVGEGTGLEVEPIENGGQISAPFDPEMIDVITRNQTIDLLLTRLQEDELSLSPDFQRRDNLWTEKQKSGLIESILLRIPIPSLYLSEDENGDYIVVDGLQRLCAIAHFIDHEALNKAVNAKLDDLRLKNLESLNTFEGKTYGELPRQLQRRISETELTLHIIRPSTPPDVKFNIFSRINRGGLPLSSQEIRNAIYRGEWRKVIHKLAESKTFLDATKNRIKKERMQDLELVLRFAAHYWLSINKKERKAKENLDDFLNHFVEKDSTKFTEKDWHQIESAFNKALEAAPKVFGDITFRKHSSAPLNRGLFEAETVALAVRSIDEINLLTSNSEQITKKITKSLDEDTTFYESLLYATGRGSASNIRIRTIADIFNEILNAQ